MMYVLLYLTLFLIAATGRETVVKKKSPFQIPKCEGLSVNENQNAKLICTNRKQNLTLDCAQPQIAGTVISHKCKPHHVFQEQSHPDDTAVSINNLHSAEEITCTQNGNWTNFLRIKSYSCVEDCGRRNVNPRPFIINGVRTNSSSWPWHAALFRRQGRSIRYICGGSIISKSAVLTAAHCVAEWGGNELLPNSTVVLVGDVLSNFTEIPHSNTKVQVLNIKKIFISQSYDARKEYQADIAVLHLAEHIVYNEEISPVCLPFPNEFGTDDLGINVERNSGYVVGFGVDESGDISQTLKLAKLEIKSHSDCFLRLDQILSESQFCAGNQRAGNITKTVCNGDSGGGFVVPSFIHHKYFIYGIVSSGEGITSKGAACQNFAVFTRVSSFASWIQDVMDEISEESNKSIFTTFPYKQEAKETRRQIFGPIPRFWKNRVSSLNLSYVDIEPAVLLKSLEFCKTVETINLTQVKFIGTNPFPTRKVRLPQLRSIFVDILRDDFKVTEDRGFPQAFSREFLQSLVFFEKEIEESDFDFRDILRFKTNIIIQVHIFRLVDIDHKGGKFLLSQIPISNQILRDGLPFTLREFALSRCSLNTRLLAGQVGLQSLVLDQVNLNLAPEDFGEFLRGQTELRELVIVGAPSSEFELDWNDIPTTVQHLALTNVNLLNIVPENASVLSLPAKRHDVPSSIVFPNYRSISHNSQRQLNVKTFYCTSCQLSINSILELSSAFPKLEKLGLFQTSSLTKMLQISKRNFHSFKNLDLVYNSPTSSTLAIFQKLVKLENGTLVEFVVEDFEVIKLNYKQNRLAYFWSSEADYSGLSRIPQVQRLAFETGSFKFNGNLSPFENGTIRPLTNVYEDSLALIPKFVQERLETIEVNNTDISYDTWLDSLKFCKRVKEIRLVNVSSTNSLFREPAELPELDALVEYYVITSTSITLPLFCYKGFKLYIHSVFHQFFPFKPIDYDFRTSLLKATVQKFHFQFGECIELKWDRKTGNLVSSLSFTNDWFRNLPKSVQVRKLAFKFQELESDVIPTSVTHLNLNFAIVRNFSAMLGRIGELKQLRFINVRLMPGEDHQNWEWATLNLEELSVHSNSLEFLSLAKTHVTNNPRGILFQKLQTLYLEGCSVEIQIGQNFESIFPKVKNLILLHTKNESKVTHGLILYNALKAGHVKWILSTTQGFFNDTSGNKFCSSELLKEQGEIEGILQRAGVGVKSSKYFIIERKMGSWVGRNVAETRIRPLLDNLKGMQDFGTAWQCHAHQYTEGSPSETLP